MSATFDFNDFLTQMEMMQNMGGMGGLMKMMPGMSGMSDREMQEAEKSLKVAKSLIMSMTPQERRFPDMLVAGGHRGSRAGSASSAARDGRTRISPTPLSCSAGCASRCRSSPSRWAAPPPTSAPPPAQRRGHEQAGHGGCARASRRVWCDDRRSRRCPRMVPASAPSRLSRWNAREANIFPRRGSDVRGTPGAQGNT